MKNLRVEDIAKEMICLECGRDVEFHRIDEASGILVCKKCFNIYTLSEGIITALPKKYLDKEAYLDFFVSFKIFFDKNATLKSRFTKFLNRLPKKTKKWEDDDVLFWDEKYEKEYLELKTKALVSRAYLRDKILFRPLRNFGFKNHYILEVGCGEAISVQKSLLAHSNDFIYFATDYSYQGLKFLKKKLKNKKNIIYIQCLGDAIPFKDEMFDDIICLGVIHHMPKKEVHVGELFKKLKTGGFLLINEPYERDYKLPKSLEKIVQRIIEPDQSAHEERINRDRFMKNLRKEGKIISEFHGHTPTKTVLIKITGSLYERSVGFVKLVILLDKTTEKSLGKIWHLFAAGECLALVKKE
ncbi:MAG: methyltransferase domain-containing protein [Candidatus Berkelbacteria bacterium]|nr:methyltransferase domain-containing protein [Candidatus Berkelbacteria bacterium]